MSGLADVYARQFESCTIRSEHAAEVQGEVDRMRMHRQRYAEVAGQFPGMPWWVPAVLHSMECGLDFHQHLHNGDPLSARTVQVPKGRPLKGKPPFTWEESAVDALVCDGLDQVRDWSAGAALVAFENYNGTGYRRRGVPSPYLWSYTDLYRCGKYTADGHYDPQAVSRQSGCAALMRLLLEP
ncbi:peptidoglycan-binding protein [Prosthecobacter vanneervenii]|uniref:Lysozyme family protein n=1 Tax=Prosthecobacter vanneervenii TaxID=48466 RepID=A0A7W7YGG6_9BACT|nr:peptidoglycan-binding protein [Prosthecobacter vanneervenii]MBB5035562.1 lysozyme family protein [Prosthecobacter vanneervenii]